MLLTTVIPPSTLVDLSLPTFLLAVNLSQSPLSEERDTVFARHLSNSMAHLAEAASHSQGLEVRRKLVWWNLDPVRALAALAFVIQRFCRTICRILGNYPPHCPQQSIR